MFSHSLTFRLPHLGKRVNIRASGGGKKRGKFNI
jgi:hypothetical protein